MGHVFSLPQSTSALDRWSDRANRIVYWEFVLALVSVIAAWSYFPKPSDFEHDHPTMTKTKMAVAVPTIFLPLASCVTSWRAPCLRVRVRKARTDKDASTKVSTKPLVYSAFQVLQAIACSCVTARDFVILSARRPWFWFSLVGTLMPALAGTIYGLVGIARFYFAGSTQLALHHYHAPTASEEYSDDTIEHCALERAYQQQLPDDATESELSVDAPTDWRRANDGDILLLQLQHEETSYTRSGPIQPLETSATTQEPGASKTTPRDDQTRPRQAVDLATMPRFRWQEQTGARDGGATFWSPMIAASGMSSFWGLYYRWLIRNTDYSPERTRQLILEAILPLFTSGLSIIFLTWSLRRPLLGLIFTAFCFTALASAIWFAEFVYSVGCFFYYMRQISVGFNLTNFALLWVTFGMTVCYVTLLLCSVRMESTPGYTSLAGEYKLWKERRFKGAADTEVTEDEEI